MFYKKVFPKLTFVHFRK